MVKLWCISVYLYINNFLREYRLDKEMRMNKKNDSMAQMICINFQITMKPKSYLYGPSIVYEAINCEHSGHSWTRSRHQKHWKNRSTSFIIHCFFSYSWCRCVLSFKKKNMNQLLSPNRFSVWLMFIFDLDKTILRLLTDYSPNDANPCHLNDTRLIISLLPFSFNPAPNCFIPFFSPISHTFVFFFLFFFSFGAWFARVQI